MMRSLVAYVAVLAVGSMLAGRAAAGVDYARDVLPILSDACYHCHGPDATARKAGLRLDTKDGAFRVRRGKAVLVPGKADESELVARVFSSDPERVMPPPDSNRKLTPKQAELLRQWVREGATWGGHWAFSPMGRPAVPAVRRTDWVRNPVDAFILARLEQEGLAPAGEADRETLLRRVALDLAGLPPTPAEVNAFLADSRPDAYERAVERLLASPRYGERMAADWLDVARFADTHGYQMDRYRPMWPWRDWVIRSYNRNQPFDQFVTWQLAGDLLPGATQEQRLATAFNRLHLQNEEGGIVEEEFRVAYVTDRVVTFGTAFLGLTLDCARCHDHKYDPVTMRDFYGLFSFFQNIDESGQTSYFTDAMPVPTVLLAKPDQEARLAEARRKVAAKEQELAEARVGAEKEFRAWLTKRSQPPDEVLGAEGIYPLDELTGNRSVNRAGMGEPAVGHEGPRLVPGVMGMAVELSGENGLSFPGVGHFRRVDPFSLAVWLKPARPAPRAVVLHHSKAPIDAGSRGYELLLEDGRVAFGLHHMWPRNSLKVVTRTAVPAGEWTHVAVTYDGSSRAAGVRVYLNGQPAGVEVLRDGLFKDITYGGGEPALALGYRFRDNGFKGGQADDVRVYRRALTPLEAAAVAGRDDLARVWQVPADQLSAGDLDRLREHYLAWVDAAYRQRAEELHQLRVEENLLVNPVTEAMAMEEMPAPRPAYVLKRGQYDARGEAVTARTPGSLPPWPSDAPGNRLGLARWLTDPEHPLLARVTVNRLWQQAFGRGLVETSDNFGSQGTPPTHPELLDWLGREFVRSGWDQKALVRLLVTSAAYRQSSRTPAEVRARDPDNLLLARGPVRRLSAEMLRDQALAVSGLLAERLGGPSVKPYQPEGLWEEKAMGAPRYDQGKGEDLHRRSLYTFWKRTVPHPAMIAFDASERNVCTVRRQTTSTPLQALALLNDTQMVEAARVLGQRMLRDGGSSPSEQVAWAFRAATGRKASEREVAVLVRLFEEQREGFRKDRAAAERLLRVGEAPRDGTGDAAEQAAAAVVGQAVLNHDGTVLRR